MAMPSRAALIGLVVVTSVSLGGIATVPRLAPVVGWVLAVAAAAMVPRAAIVAVLPLLLWPGETVVGGQPLGLVLTACVVAGVLLRRLPGLRAVAGPAMLVLGLATLGALSWFLNEGSSVVAPQAARNSLLATLVGLGLVLAVAVSGVRRDPVLKVLALMGAVATVRVLMLRNAVSADRLETDLLNPNAVGQIAAMSVLTAVGLALALRQVRWACLALPALPVLALASSRGSIVIVVSGMLALWISRGTSARRLAGAALLPVAALLAWPLLQTLLGVIFARRLSTQGALDSDGRWEAITLAAELAVRNPLTGIGWRRFPDYSIAALGYPLNVHNEFLRVAAEAGLVAGACLVLLVVYALRAVSESTVDSACKAVLVGGAAGLALSNNLSSLPVTGVTLVVLGLLVTPSHPLGAPALGRGGGSIHESPPQDHPRPPPRRPLTRVSREDR